MYETLEHWKQYNKEKELQNKISKEFGLDKAIEELMTKEMSHKEFDKQLNKLTQEFSSSTSDNSNKLVTDYSEEDFDEWMDNLGKKNGYTNY
jgi:hypothetical protein